MLSNEKLTKLVKATHNGSGVTLSVEEADKFITYALDQSVLKNNCRIVKMTAPEKYIDAVGLGDDRVLVPAGSFDSDSYITGTDYNQIKLSTQKARGCVAIYDDDIEDAPQGVDWTDTVMKLIAARVGNELEEIAWISDTHSLSGFGASDIRSKFDGWRYQIANSASDEDYVNDISGSATLLDASNTSPNADFRIAGGISEYDADGEPPWEHKFHKMLKSMPAKYWSIAPDKMRFWQHPKVTFDYAEALSGRMTALGDAAILGSNMTQYGKIPLVDAPKMPVTLDANGVLNGGSYTDCLLTPAANLIMGIQRSLKLEKYRDAANERDLWFFSIRMCFAVENVNACVLTHSLTTS